MGTLQIGRCVTEVLLIHRCESGGARGEKEEAGCCVAVHTAGWQVFEIQVLLIHKIMRVEGRG